MNQEDEKTFDPEKQEAQREAQLEHYQSAKTRAEKRLEHMKQVAEARETMYEISLEQLEPENPQWGYETDEEYLEALRDFKEGMWKINKANDEQKIQQLKQAAQKHESSIEDLKEEMNDE